MKIMERKELIQSARKLYNNPWSNDALKKALEESFPELKESKDERIRKALIKGLKDSGWTHFSDDLTISEIIAYLEKQKEQKPVERVEINKSLSDAVITELGKYNGENYWKSPWAIDSTGLQYPLYFANLGAKWQKEQKQEWSEEDEKMLNVIIGNYRDNDLPAFESDRKDVIDWLKSLPSRFSIQPHWKPSEEQMEVFGEFILPYGTAHEKIVLNGLYNELKKL